MLYEVITNPANVAGIRVATKLFPDVPQVAVFDTAFHGGVAYHRAIIEEDPACPTASLSGRTAGQNAVGYSVGGVGPGPAAISYNFV